MIRLFPNMENYGSARFEKLRAAGAFLLSASHDGKSVVRLKIFSEKGRTPRFVSPWAGRNMQIVRESDDGRMPHTLDRNEITAKTEAGETYLIASA